MPEADFPATGETLVDPGPVGPEPHDAVPGEIKNVSGQVLYLAEVGHNVDVDASALVDDVTTYRHQPAWEVVPAKTEPAPAKPVFQTADKFTEPTPAASAPVEK